MTATIKSFPQRPTLDPPKTLSKAAVTVWRKLTAEYETIDEHGLLILEVALQSWDRMNQATQVLDKEGITVKGVGGRAKAHPALAVERDCRAAFTQGMKVLASLELPDESKKRRR